MPDTTMKDTDIATQMVIELGSAFLMATLPCMIFYWTGGQKGLDEIVHALNPGPRLINYFMVFLFLYVALRFVLNWFMLERTRVGRLIHILHLMVQNVGYSLIGVFRVALGLALFLVICVAAGQTPPGSGLLSMAVFDGVVILLMNVVLARTAAHIDRHWRDPAV